VTWSWRTAAGAGLIALGFGASAYFLWPGEVVRHPAGAMAPDPPEQLDLVQTPAWTSGKYLVTARARSKVRARVLGRERYYVGREADLSPLDLVLAWGPMSDQSAIDRVEIDQGSRRYTWWTDEAPLPLREIELSTANVHMVPSTEPVRDMLLAIDRGELVELEGYLVQIEGDDGWIWETSMTRADTGDGACEVFWVDGIRRRIPFSSEPIGEL
jgi:hypothetical protein